MSAVDTHRPSHARLRRRSGLKFYAIRPLFTLVEATIVTGSAVLSAAAYHSLILGNSVALSEYANLGLVMAAIYVSAAHRLKLYQVHELLRDVRGYYSRVLLAVGLSTVILTLLLFVLKIGASVSRGSLIYFAVSCSLGLILWRLIAAHELRRAFESRAVLGRRAILIGDDKELGTFSRRDLLMRFGIDEIARFVLNSQGNFTDSVEEMTELAARSIRGFVADEIILALPWADSARLDLLRTRLRRLPVSVQLLPDCFVTALLPNAPWTMGNYILELQRAPLSRIERFCKRSLDLIVAVFSLVVLSPFMLLVAIAVRIDSPGPAIFRQRRRGFNEKEFQIYKFRTMKTVEDGDEIAQAVYGDARVTKVGRLLRSTSIDELPQLLNVIRGDMSIVGPRPHALAHNLKYEQVIANYARRHHVKPGITGLAQAGGLRGETSQPNLMARRVELDIEYVNNWSIALDIKIVLRTVPAVLGARNAY